MGGVKGGVFCGSSLLQLQFPSFRGGKQQESSEMQNGCKNAERVELNEKRYNDKQKSIRKFQTEIGYAHSSYNTSAKTYFTIQ
jgi:hypothetical protein